MIQTDKRQKLMDIANLIVEHSDGRAVLAFQEEDKTSDKVKDAAHFIKVDGKRICRDIEMYGFLGKVTGWEQTLAMFLEEVIFPVKSLGLAESYQVAGEELKQLGHEVYSAEMLERWNDLFVDN